tara:strand:- start:433 stop:639 length:207 start_codon:yes stop_codon:yes gene_type:complete
MKTFSETDYVLYNRENNLVARFAFGREYVIFGSKEEAEEDCRGHEQEVVKCTELPKHWQRILLNQINK